MRTMVPLAALAALCLTACARALPGPPPTPSSTVEQDGVRLILRLDKVQYAPGDVLRADVRIENISDHPVTWVGGGCNLPAAVTARAPSLQGAGESWDGAPGLLKRAVLAGMPDLTRITFLEASALEARRAGRGGPFCTAAIREVQLEPGGVLQTRLAWDGTLPLEGTPARAPSGWIAVEAVFPMGRIDSPTPLAVRLQVDLSGGPAWIISPGEAVDAALRQPRFYGRIEGLEWPQVTGRLQFVGGRWELHGPAGEAAVIDPVQGRVLDLKLP